METCDTKSATTPISEYIDKWLIVGAVALIHVYRYMLSPWIGNQCRFNPTCSHYAEIAFSRHGFLKGFYLTTYRLCRCQPLCRGGFNPVSEKH